MIDAQSEFYRNKEEDLLKQIIKPLVEAQESATRTGEVLNSQTEQLHKIEADSQAIEDNLVKSDRILKSLRPFGWLKDLVKRDSTDKPGMRKRDRLRASLGIGRSTESASSKHGYPETGEGSSVAKAPSVRQRWKAARAKITAANAFSEASQNSAPVEEKSETDKQYDQIERLLEGLQHQGEVIHKTVLEQNEKLDAIAQQVDRSDQKIQQQQAEIRKQLQPRGSRRAKAERSQADRPQADRSQADRSDKKVDPPDQKLQK